MKSESTQKIIYILVVFKDMSNDEVFLCKSTAETKDTI